MKQKPATYILSILIGIILFSSCASISHYMPAFAHTDDIYVSPPNPDQEENVRFDMDSGIETNFLYNTGIAKRIYTASIQAAATGRLSVKLSENNLIAFSLTPGLLAGMADKLKNENEEFAIFENGFLYSLGFFTQADLNYFIYHNRDYQLSIGLSYTISYEYYGSYLDYRLANSDIDLGDYKNFCSQSKTYLDFQFNRDQGWVFIRPFSEYSNYSTLISFDILPYTHNLPNQDQYKILVFFDIYPDFGIYIGYRDKVSYYLKLKLIKLMKPSVSFGIGFL